MEKKVKKEEGVSPSAEVFDPEAQTRRVAAGKANPGFSWWLLLGAVVGFAVLLLVGAVVLLALG